MIAHLRDAADPKRLVLSGVGLLLLVYGAANPGSSSQLIMLSGSTAVVLGVMLPALTLTTLELGLGPVKATLTPGEAEFRRAFAERAERWQRFAWLVCGDTEEARDLVEQSLEEARLRQRMQTIDQLIRYALSTLVSLLETAPERSLFGTLFKARPTSGTTGSEVELDDGDREMLEALKRLDVRLRLTYLLRIFFGLSLEEVADIAHRPPDDVARDFDAAQLELNELLAQSGA